ncbi:MAG: CDP-alcohol phosphatidyltransferase family protein [Candidatus Doudnabacteria bacterium]|nr:CDP-alcohol phosphatidyltransferase family protein [Candidatus Doudnabacteria bacterium]
MKRQIPNAISAIRVALAYPVASYALADQWTLSFWLLVIGWLTDFLDGFVAKRLKVADKNEFGKKWADPISDACLNAGSIIGLLQGPEKPWVFGLGLASFVLMVSLKTLKHWGWSDEVRRLSASISFEFVVISIAVILNIYAYRGLHWGPTGIVLTIPILLYLRRAKRQRIERVYRLGF